MSNLLKQNYIINKAEDSVRVINFNDQIEAKLAKLAKQQAAKATQNEDFTEGLILSEEVVTVPEEHIPTPEEVLEEARAQAKEILEEARTQADQMLNDAHVKGLMLYEEQKSKGYEDGKELLEMELEEEKKQFLEQLAADKMQAEQLYAKQLETMENDVLDAILQVIDHVFFVQFSDKKEILISLVKNVLQNVEAGKNFRIHVAPENAPVLMEQLDSFASIVGNGVNLEVVRDQKLTETDCQIETEYGLFDCGIDTQFQNLMKDIRSLCI